MTRAEPVARRSASARARRPPSTSTSISDRPSSAELDFTAALLREVRLLVAREARQTRLSGSRCEDLVLAIDELATNSVTHGGGSGTLTVWRDEDAIACEVRDSGHIDDPLVGLRPPDPEQLSGRGLWVVSRLCDHVQISSSPGRTLVRVQMTVRARG